jgi:hypothetical protein
MAFAHSRPRAKRPRAEPEAVGDLMNAVLERIGGQGRAREHSVFSCWDRVVGDTVGRRARPESLKGTTLFVRVSSSALAHELTVLRGDIITRMCQELGVGVVTEVRTKVGPG